MNKIKTAAALVAATLAVAGIGMFGMAKPAMADGIGGILQIGSFGPRIAGVLQLRIGGDRENYGQYNRDQFQRRDNDGRYRNDQRFDRRDNRDNGGWGNNRDNGGWGGNSDNGGWGNRGR